MASEFAPIPAVVERAATTTVHAAYRVHRELGPGLLEHVYEICMAHELTRGGATVQRQLPLPIEYDGVRLDAGFKLDLLVNDALVVELKSVESLIPVHKAQVLTYLKLTRRRLGLLINFNVPRIKDGIQRVIL